MLWTSLTLFKMSTQMQQTRRSLNNNHLLIIIIATRQDPNPANCKPRSSCTQYIRWDQVPNWGPASIACYWLQRVPDTCCLCCCLWYSSSLAARAWARARSSCSWGLITHPHTHSLQQVNLHIRHCKMKVYQLGYLRAGGVFRAVSASDISNARWRACSSVYITRKTNVLHYLWPFPIH